MSPEAARSARELQMLETMVDCAHALGLTFGEAAKAAPDMKRRLELFDAFHKGFLALRMGIRLCMTLRTPPKAARVAAERAEAPEHDPVERDPSERERSDSAERVERERERDYEPVSLPRFLATLGLVARDAERLDLPADAAQVLPTLKDLLARAATAPPDPAPTAPQAAGVAVLARPPQSGTRHKLLSSAATSLPRPGPRTAPPWSGSG